MRIGIDLGGTKIELLALDVDGTELHRQRIPTPQGNYQTILKCIHSLIKTTETTLNLKGSIGVCTPGSNSPTTNLLHNSNSICLNNKPFKQDLKKFWVAIYALLMMLIVSRSQKQLMAQQKMQILFLV